MLGKRWTLALAVAVALATYVERAVALPQENSVSPSELDPMLEQIAKAHTTLKDFHARVRQKKYFADLGDEVTFLGAVSYAKPRKMLWEFTQPDPSTLLIHEQGISLLIPGIKQVQVFGAHGRRNIEERINGYFLAFEQSVQQLKQMYRMQWGGQQALEQGSAYLVKLFRPTDPFAAEVWIWFAVEGGMPLRMLWKTAQGDITQTDFFDIKINQGLAPNTFVLNIPQGFETVMAQDL